MELSNVVFTKENQIGFVVLNRPQVHNALNHALFLELDHVIKEIKDDPEIRVAILTGAGEKAFVSGADIGELSTLDVISGWESSRDHQGVLDRLERMGKPSIAAINGLCFGGGLELAVACTLRIASEKAVLGLPELGLGILPGFGGVQRLMRLVGRGKAAEMILTAKPVDAKEALRIGLVNQVVFGEELLPKAREMAQSISKNGPTAITLAMEVMQRGMDMSLDNGLAFESAMAAMCIGTPEAAQRLKIFLERNK